MKIFYDCEFLENGRTIKLISIGLVREDGEHYYAVNADMPLEKIKQHRWLMHNVIPDLPLINRNSLDQWATSENPETAPMPRFYGLDLDRNETEVRPHWVIANEVRDFIQTAGYDVELWADYGAYDHVALCQLWGRMIDLPVGVPMFTHEFQQYHAQAGKPELPERSDADEHHALADAAHLARCYEATVAWIAAPMKPVSVD